MKVLTIVGARPQFVKAAAVSRAFSKVPEITEIIIHTGQHFDENMSDIFFNQMQIPKPHYNLGIDSLGHGAMTGRMMEEIEKILLKEKPDWLLVYGDTNSTLAGALAAQKIHIKVVHIEAGLRSFNMNMPEEVNRILTDRISTMLCCPNDQAMINLEKEGYNDFDTRVVKTGDVMQDVALFYTELAQKPAVDLPKQFVLTTIHRAENTNDIEKLKTIFAAFNEIAKDTPIVLPIHPRTKNLVEKHKIDIQFQVIPPVGYLEMVYLLKNCKLVMTDSGGLQKEAFFFRKPCITLRDQTEWVELIEHGVNELVEIDKNKIINACKSIEGAAYNFNIDLYGGGKAAERIAQELLHFDAPLIVNDK